MHLKVEASFDQDEAKKCLAWMKAVGVGDADDTQCSHDAFYELLHDGNILCKSVLFLLQILILRKPPSGLALGAAGPNWKQFCEAPV